jgi:hypothetical protein
MVAHGERLLGQAVVDQRLESAREHVETALAARSRGLPYRVGADPSGSGLASSGRAIVRSPGPRRVALTVFEDLGAGRDVTKPLAPAWSRREGSTDRSEAGRAAHQTRARSAHTRRRAPTPRSANVCSSREDGRAPRGSNLSVGPTQPLEAAALVAQTRPDDPPPQNGRVHSMLDRNDPVIVHP